MSCYREASSTHLTKTSPLDQPCGSAATSDGYQACCPMSTGAICLSNYICYEPFPPTGGSGFLTTSCTDQTYESGECTKHCTDLSVPDIVYDPATGLWACCGVTANGTLSCANPTSETFQAPAPDVLLYNAVVSSSTSTSGATTSTSSATSSAAATLLSKAQQTSNGLSPGAKVAVGIGVAIVFAGILVLLTWAILATRKLRKLRHQQAGDFSYPKASQVEYAPQELSSQLGGFKPELPAAEPGMKRQGAGDVYNAHELGG